MGQIVRFGQQISILFLFIGLAGCATIIESNCALQDFEGTYIGRYNVGGIIPIPINDTIDVSVDLERNEATVTSVLLDTSFVTNFADESNELRISALAVPLFQFGDNLFYDVSVEDGYATLDGECDALYIQMNKVSVADHNIPGIPKPITNLDLTSPNFMRRIR